MSDRLKVVSLGQKRNKNYLSEMLAKELRYMADLAEAGQIELALVSAMMAPDEAGQSGTVMTRSFHTDPTVPFPVVQAIGLADYTTHTIRMEMYDSPDASAPVPDPRDEENDNDA